MSAVFFIMFSVVWVKSFLGRGYIIGETQQCAIVAPLRMIPHGKIEKDRNSYYAGLWNAAGLACPTNPLLQDFKMEEIPYKEKSPPDNKSQDNKCGDGK